MTLLEPWALLGLVAIALPIAAHLLARRPPRRLRFPNLRFLPPTVAMPVRRDRLADLVLLALRAAILGMAALALAQPVWLTSSRARDLGRQIARAVIVDSSASMQRLSPDGRAAIDIARTRAKDVVADATASRIAEAASPASAIPGAVAWLEAQSMRREVVVISDFQTTAIDIDSDALSGVPAGIGVRLIEVPATGVVTPSAAETHDLELLTSDGDRAGAAAAFAAAVRQGAPARIAGNRNVTLVFPTASGRDALLKNHAPLSRSWMGDVFAAVATDPLVGAAAARLGRTPLDVLSASGDPAQPDRLVVFVDASAHSLVASATISAVLRSASPEVPASELVTTNYSPAELRQLERPPSPPGSSSVSSEASDPRWAWLAAGVLLLVETFVRRRRVRAPQSEVRARVA